ncbi:MAG: TIGR02757 family protein [Deltaproteobacteria bacterium]|nr:TIGR02757 family protein [Deltaproteobacteria bacterium]
MLRSELKLSDFRKKLEDLYVSYNRRCYVHPDPLEFLYVFDDPQDREIVALIASSLAYGRVEQILRSISEALRRMDVSPRLYLSHSTFETIQSDFADFKHRFTSAKDFSMLLWSLRNMIRNYGSLHACFMSGYRNNDENILPALSLFVEKLLKDLPFAWSGFLPSPARGSACKRLNLFLRWLIREDEVDPGGWDGISSSKLIVPLDTHMHRISLMLGLTKRKQADLRTTLEITEAFRSLSPEDPVRYDFALTRFGIRNDMDEAHLAAICGKQQV